MRIKLLLIAILFAPPVAMAYEPTSNYTVRNIEGWKVLVNNKLLKEEKDLGKKTLKLLADQLCKINTVVPRSALVEIHKVPIWVELNCKGHACMCYHPSRGWLKNNGFNPEKEKFVRAELKKHDPKMHGLLAKLWKGMPRKPEQRKKENPK